ncbi:MAG: T9SS type A sorting domain-containing protein [Bacteroidia bacterium]
MKKFTLCLGSLLLFCVSMRAQNGLENVIVETYYISDANDTMANADGGVLPIGSVTYRIYADLLPGYKFQAGYGVPGHEVRFETSTLFFNNEDRGATTPTYTKVQSKANTVMLDSWLSVGAACAGNFGIMKVYDDGAATNVNSFTPQVLQNADTLAGIPISVQDGIILITARTPEPVTQVGIATEIEVFNNQNDGTNGPVFSTSNGSWAALNGAIGPDTVDNKVLIGQITTDGVFTFKLNIQIGTPTGGVQNYVAENPVANEIQIPSLIYPDTTGTSGIGNNTPDIPLFLVYPNPVKDLLTIKIIPSKQSNENSYTIYDINGRIVFHKNLGTSLDKYLDQVDMSSFAQGQYIIELVSNGVASSKKFIKD